MSGINLVAIPKEYSDLLKGHSDYDPSKYSEKLKNTSAIECFEERILALRKLYLEYERKIDKTLAICFSDIVDGITSDESEERKKELKNIISEEKVIAKEIGEMLAKYNEVQFPDYLDKPISKVSFLIRKNMISNHT